MIPINIKVMAYSVSAFSIFRNTIFMGVLAIYFVRLSEKSVLHQERIKQKEARELIQGNNDNLATIRLPQYETNRGGSNTSKKKEEVDGVFAMRDVIYNSKK
jgi:hypothetical protein